MTSPEDTNMISESLDAAQLPKPPVGFLSLPIEVRKQIYALLPRGDKFPSPHPQNLRFTGLAPHTISQTCRQIRQEVVTVLDPDRPVYLRIPRATEPDRKARDAHGNSVVRGNEVDRWKDCRPTRGLDGKLHVLDPKLMAVLKGMGAKFDEIKWLSVEGNESDIVIVCRPPLDEGSGVRLVVTFASWREFVDHYSVTWCEQRARAKALERKLQDVLKRSVDQRKGRGLGLREFEVLRTFYEEHSFMPVPKAL